MDAYEDLPLFIVNQGSAKKYTIMDIYRKSHSDPAKLAPTSSNLSIGDIKRLDTVYFLKLFWKLEPESETFRL